ncbi:glucosaminidase domain-containing protein [Psychroserpens sp. SPM9]|uniref:glucosaminidase domain-containing protein n=1 Tax=Psychroserpens sp. SPM9 TaxID=2975598 RepID=UPI0021A777DC|nr:glucosaminidase domain-containing protein [Psychroserpens sp. SPM9]MDG5489950.1 glucosaminidase domain-containing protein [Psychroserpens sp. SPM9]
MKKICVVVLVCLIAFSCGSKKRIITKKDKRTQKTEQVVVKPKTTTPENTSKVPDVPSNSSLNSTEIYILKYNAIAMDEMRTSKIPASITLAQGILESGSGKGRLSVEANNHFGIKCHGWTGKKIYHDDDKSQECFRKYDYAFSSFEDHSEFLTGRSRYANLFKLRPDDYKGWAKGLRAAGYATDKKYPQKLISLIERYQLYKYDDMVLNNRPSPTQDDLPEDYVSVSHRVVKGDTLYSLSKKYNTTVDELKRLNGLKTNDLSLGQMLIIKTR